MKKNVSNIERIITTAAGAALAAYGFTPKVDYTRFSVPSIITGLAGTALSTYGLFFQKNRSLLTTVTGAALSTYGFGFQKKRTVSTRNLVLGIVGAGIVARGVTGFCPVYKAVGIGKNRGTHTADMRKGKRVTESILVNAPLDKVYKLWSNFENFPQWMNNVESVTPKGNDLSHWKVKSKTGVVTEFDSRIKTNVTNEVISWESVSGDVPNAGAARFKNVGGLTQVEVTIEINPPGGLVGKAVADMIGDPETQLKEDLLKFKQVAEATKHETHTTPATNVKTA